MAGIAVIIPNFNGAQFLEACLTSLLSQTAAPEEILIVDNASSDDSCDIVRRTAPNATILRQTCNLGFAAAVNVAVGLARAEWIAVANNDTEFAPDWLLQCQAAIERHPDAQFLACRIMEHSTENRIYSAGDCFLRAGIGYRRGQGRPDHPEYREDTEVFAPCGCAALYRRSVFRHLGGYDGQYFAYLEDVDLGFRMRAAGHRGYYAASATVYHIGGATSGGEYSPLSVRLQTRNSLLLLLKNYPWIFCWRGGPMILAWQLAWLARVLGHGRLLSYLRGLAEAAKAAFHLRRKGSRRGRLNRESRDRLWRLIIEAERMARRDLFIHAGKYDSTFLRWYFRLF